MEAEFGSPEHIKRLSRENLESLFRYVWDSREELNTIVRMRDREISDLKRKVANQSRQLKNVQSALERRNNDILKPRWQRAMDKLKAENERLGEVTK